MARHEGWRVLLRIEDIDAARCRQAHEHSIRESLRWLGIDWDEEVDAQSLRRPRHIDPLRTLCSEGMAFHAAHSRRELRAHESTEPREEAAPHAGDEVLRFPRSLRPAIAASTFDAQTGPWRLRNEAAPTLIQDGFLGELRVDTADVWGDPIIWTRDGSPSYQWAVTIDDADDGVTDVIRGSDLLQSAALQDVLHRALGHAPPSWWHVPLVRDAEGARLAKRTGAASLAWMQEGGARAGDVVALVARMVGLHDGTAPLSSHEFSRLCSPSALRDQLSSRRTGIVALP